MPLLGASFAVEAIGAGVGAGALEFGVRFGVRDGPLLLERLWVGLWVRLSAMANPVSGALAVGAAAVVALDEIAWAGAVSRIGEADVGPGSPVVERPGVELLTLESLDLGAVGCFASGGSARGAELFSLTGDCRVGIGVGVGAGAGAGDVGGETLKAGSVGGDGIELWADGSAGWSEKLPGSDDGAAFVGGAAGVSGAGVNGAAGTDGDWTIGDWSSAKMVAPVGIGA